MYEASGGESDFTCGVSLRYFLRINQKTGEISDAGFTTNGCGFVVAAADVLCGLLRGRKLVELNGLKTFEAEVEQGLGEVPGGRTHCINLCFDSLAKTLAKYRRTKTSEWNGESPLVCSCFGVDEAAVENAARESGADTVTRIGEITNAGTGCGSCQPIIEDIIDSDAP